MTSFPESKASAVYIGRSVETSLGDPSLLVLTDRADVDHCAPGYIVVRKQGVRLNGQWFDLGIAHTHQKPSILPSDFYLVPLTEIPSDNDGALHLAAAEQWQHTALPWQFVRTPEEVYRAQVTAMPRGAYVRYHPFHTSSLDSLLPVLGNKAARFTEVVDQAQERFLRSQR
ncbi:MAG: hypothetical protein AABX37_06350 [Nanoarchaeota archaeon]